MTPNIRAADRARPGQTPQQEPQDLNTFLTFEIGGVLFAVDVCNVREILDPQKITPVPNAPHDLVGIIDVRGQGIAVVDLASRLGMCLANEGISRIVVFEMGDSESPVSIGVPADHVQSVAEIPPERVEPVPETMSSWRADILRGVTRIDGVLTIILELDRVFEEAPSLSSFDFETAE